MNGSCPTDLLEECTGADDHRAEVPEEELTGFGNQLLGKEMSDRRGHRVHHFGADMTKALF